MTEETTSPETAVVGQGGSDAEETSSARRLFLRVSDDQVKVLLDAEDPLADIDGTAAGIREACEDLKLPEIPDLGSLRSFLEQTATGGQDLADELLIVGRYPVPAVDGRFQWSREFFQKGWAVDEATGTMNFWEPLERRSISAGEEICRLIPPVPGKTGLTVFDQPIPVRKPRQEKVRSGKNVEVVDEADGTRIFLAKCDGRVLHAVGVVSVDDVYLIKGDVSLETGNVDHTGSVQITGDVKAGARIEVGGDVVVQGLVEPSRIKCGGSLTVNGGIVGDGTGTVDAGGNVQALYISEATITCGGDLIVRNEVTHADVACHGDVLAPEGRIAGGRVVAQGSIRVGAAGASGSTGTVLIAGLDPTLETRVAKLREQLPRLEKIRAKLRKTLHRFRMETEDLDEEQRLVLSEVRTKTKQIEAAIAQVGLDIDEIRATATRSAGEEILVHQELWSGTTVQVGDVSLNIRKSVHKPRKVRRSGSDLVVLPMAEDVTVD